MPQLHVDRWLRIIIVKEHLAFMGAKVNLNCVAQGIA